MPAQDVSPPKDVMPERPKDELHYALKILDTCTYFDDKHSGKLHGAVSANDLTLVMKCIKDGANINSKNDVGQTPLTLAVGKKNCEIAQCLIDHGADLCYKTPLELTILDLAKDGFQGEKGPMEELILVEVTAERDKVEKRVRDIARQKEKAEQRLEALHDILAERSLGYVKKAVEERVKREQSLELHFDKIVPREKPENPAKMEDLLEAARAEEEQLEEKAKAEKKAKSIFDPSSSSDEEKQAARRAKKDQARQQRLDAQLNFVRQMINTDLTYFEHYANILGHYISSISSTSKYLWASILNQVSNQPIKCKQLPFYSTKPLNLTGNDWKRVRIFPQDKELKNAVIQAHRMARDRKDKLVGVQGAGVPHLKAMSSEDQEAEDCEMRNVNIAHVVNPNGEEDDKDEEEEVAEIGLGLYETIMNKEIPQPDPNDPFGDAGDRIKALDGHGKHQYFGRSLEYWEKMVYGDTKRPTGLMTTAKIHFVMTMEPMPFKNRGVRKSISTRNKDIKDQAVYDMIMDEQEALHKPRVRYVNTQVSKPIPPDEVIGYLTGEYIRKSCYEEHFYAFARTSGFLFDPGVYYFDLKMSERKIANDQLVLLLDSPYTNVLNALDDYRADPLRILLDQDDEKPSQSRHHKSRKETAVRSHEESSGRSPGDKTPKDRNKMRKPPRARDDDGKNLALDAIKSEKVGEREEARSPNVKFCEVIVKGVPYVFVVTTAPIKPGDEVLVDRGQNFWNAHAFSLKRLQYMSQISSGFKTRVQYYGTDSQ